MTREFLEDNRVNAIEFNASQRTVLGTLGIGKIQYNMLRKLEDPAIRDLEILRYKPDLKWEEFNDLDMKDVKDATPEELEELRRKGFLPKTRSKRISGKPLTPYERTRAQVAATGNRWAMENFYATHS